MLVLAWRKGVKITAAEDLEQAEIKTVCYPDPKAAIYGRAAAKFLETSGIGAKIKDKVSQVSTVPQVLGYLTSGEMDAGFINRVAARSGAEKLGGSLEIADGYQPISMTAAVVQGQANPEVKAFLNFLRTDKAKEILKKQGVW